MARKITFSIVYASDEDLAYPASELNTHGPTVQGWRSHPDSNITPHDIILRFHKPARICRIQVLAHQYLIPQKIELWLHYSPKEIPSTPSSQCFDLLGFIALSDNSTTNYKSRELQSVTVSPRNGTHLKLRLGSPHTNEFNIHNQVALIAVNVLGEEIKAFGKEEFKNTGDSTVPPEISSTKTNANIETGDNCTEPPLLSICDDLLFSMYVEETICEIVREMELKKAKAVNDERFEYARKLKLCMTALRNAGERLGRYSLAKRQAVLEEDFITAKLRKVQIESYKKSVLKQLQVDQLLEKDGVCPENDKCSEIYASKPILPSPPSLQDVATALTEQTQLPGILSPRDGVDEKFSTAQGNGSCGKLNVGENIAKEITATAGNFKKGHDDTTNSPGSHIISRSPSKNSPRSNQGSLRRRNKSAPRNSYDDYEERAVPALRQECQGTANLEIDLNRGRSRLNDRERRQAALPILIFGTDLVEQFYSRQFQDREDGLTRLRNFLKMEKGNCLAEANKIVRSATILLHRAVRDAVYSVFNQAMETVRTLFLEFVSNRASQSEVARCVDRLLPELLARSGDPSSRIHTLAQHTILSIAACPEVREQNLVAPALSRTVGSGTHPRLALSRLQMLEQLVLSQGISTNKHSGLTCRALSECGCSGIHHPAEPVRKVAERILLLVYKVNPRLVRKQLPPDDDITRRNLLYRQLFTEFDKLDMQRKKELLETNKKLINNDLTPSSISSTAQQQQQNTKDCKISPLTTQSNNSDYQSSPVRRSAETRCVLKNRNFPTEDQNTDRSESSLNGDKQQYNEKLKQLMHSSSDKDSNSNSESAEETKTITCPFCDWVCHGDQTQLDKHYWKNCPILMKCPQCSQVLEVAALNCHLISECEAKINYTVCERCTESIHKGLYELHLMEDYCRELKPGAARCPLCHDDVSFSLEGGWKGHLLDSSGCPGNTRRKLKV